MGRPATCAGFSEENLAGGSSAKIKVLIAGGALVALCVTAACGAYFDRSQLIPVAGMAITAALEPQAEPSKHILRDRFRPGCQEHHAFDITCRAGLNGEPKHKAVRLIDAQRQA